MGECLLKQPIDLFFKMKILIVEDDHKIANSLRVGFEQEGFVVDVSYNGIEGYDLASTEEYDVMVLDLMLPGMTGEEICKNLRNEKNHTPVLILTAKSSLDDKVSGLNIGADDYMTKPFAFEELLARVRALSRRPKSTESQKYVTGDVELDPASFEVKKRGKAVPLSRKEFALFEYLIKNKGKIMSKENLISRVWSYDADVMPNNIEVFVGFIRKKLGKGIIKTIRGFGYKVEK